MTVTILKGDCRSVLATLPDESVHCVVTSPPYWGLRDYGVAGQLGMERTLGEHVETMATVFREVRRVLRSDGTLWLNYGDSYATSVNGRSAADTKAAGNDDRTFRDKPFSTIGPIYDPTPSGAGGSYEGERPGWAADRGRIRAGGTLKPKDLCGIPWRVAFALQEDGWWLRQDIIWSKPNPMPESVRDRCTKAHEYLFLLSKSERYFYDADAIKEPGSDNSHGGTPNQGGPKQEAIGQNHGGRLGVPALRAKDGNGSARPPTSRPHSLSEFEQANGREYGTRNKRSVWEVTTAPFPEAHFATFPPALIEPCILAGCPKGGTVLDPFGGAGTTGLVADRLGRNAVLIELNPEYADMAERRIKGDAGMFAEVVA